MRSITVLLVCSVTLSGAASAQDRRPATTTFLGDTGLWFVPTAELLPPGDVAVSGYRANTDREPGSTDIGHFAGTASIGLRDRVELFGSFRAVTRIDRDRRPLFAEGSSGGLVNDYPLIRTGWSGNRVGDLVLGVKVGLLSESRRRPLALAVRGMVKVPPATRTQG